MVRDGQHRTAVARVHLAVDPAAKWLDFAAIYELEIESSLAEEPNDSSDSGKVGCDGK